MSMIRVLYLVATVLIIFMGLGYCNEEEALKRLKSVSDSFEGKPAPNEASWSRWESFFGFSFPEDYKRYVTQFPHSWVGVMPLYAPLAGRKRVFRDEISMSLAIDEFKSEKMTDFETWPQPDGYFPLGLYEDSAICFKLVGGRVDQHVYYLLDLAEGGEFKFEGTFAEVLVKLVFEAFVDENLIWCTQYFRESNADGISVFSVDYPTVEDDLKWLSSLPEGERRKLGLDTNKNP